MPIPSLREIGTNLELHSEGWWTSEALSDVSYPEDGNVFCFMVEESSFWFRHRNHCILEAIRQFPPDGALFDVGGGNGFVARALQESGFEVVLVEPGLAAVRNAIKRGILQVVGSTLEDAGVSQETIPAVGLFDVIEHVPDDVEFLSRTRRLVVPGGRLYITVPAYSWLWSHADHVAGHFRRYDLARLTRVIEKAGFAVEFATYIFSFLPIPMFFRRVLPHRLGLAIKGSPEKVCLSEHEVSDPVAKRVLTAWTQWELSKIAKGRSLRVGGSCLVVARRGQ